MIRQIIEKKEIKIEKNVYPLILLKFELKYDLVYSTMENNIIAPMTIFS